MPKPKPLSKEMIVAAQANTKSNMAAARYLHVSYQHYKRYAKMYKLFDDHKIKLRYFTGLMKITYL